MNTEFYAIVDEKSEKKVVHQNLFHQLHQTFKAHGGSCFLIRILMEDINSDFCLAFARTESQLDII